VGDILAASPAVNFDHYFVLGTIIVTVDSLKRGLFCV
jgi:hypothetical protein